MFASQERTAVFPTPLWVYRLKKEDMMALNEGIAGVLDRRMGDREFPKMNVLQTSHDFHQEEPVKPLVKYIEAAVNDALKSMSLEEHEWTITGCWANVAAPGGAHIRHCHPNNFLSGVYYMSTPPGGDKIMFDDPRPHWMHIAPPMKEHAADNANTVTLNIAAGMIILFPSWLMHYVPINSSDHHRVSIAFNIMFSHFAERISAPQWRPAI